MNEIYKLPYMFLIIMCNLIIINQKIDFFQIVISLLILYAFYMENDQKFTFKMGLIIFLLSGTRYCIKIMRSSLIELGDLINYIEALKQGLDFPISMILYKFFAYIFGVPYGLKILITILTILICSLFMVYSYRNNKYFLFYITPAILFFDPAFHYVTHGMVRTLIGFTIITGYFIMSRKDKTQRILTSILLTFTHLFSLTWFIFHQIIERIINKSKIALYSLIPIIATTPILLYLGSRSGLLRSSLERWIRFSFFILYYPETKLKFFKFDFAYLSLWPIALLSIVGILLIKLIELKKHDILIWIIMLLIPFFPLMKNVYSWRFLYVCCIPLLMALNKIETSIIDKWIILSYTFLNINYQHITIGQTLKNLLNPNLSLMINIIFKIFLQIGIFAPKKVIC